MLCTCTILLVEIMNFLAHIYLSGNNKLMMIGNFIGDTVKGKDYLYLHPAVQKGVLLHRDIDDFTDKNPINAQMRKLLHPVAGKYAGVYLDMFYDHFLAANWNDFSPEVPLRNFCIRFYFDAMFRYKFLPPEIKAFLPALVWKNRLRSYASIELLRKALDIMSDWTSLPNDNDEIIEILTNNYEKFKAAFYEFFPLIVKHTARWRESGNVDAGRLQLPEMFLANISNRDNADIVSAT